MLIIKNSKKTRFERYSAIKKECKSRRIQLFVANDLKLDFPSLKSFVTLSPVPGFMGWLKKYDEKFYKQISKNISIKFVEDNQKKINENILRSETAALSMISIISFKLL